MFPITFLGGNPPCLIFPKLMVFYLLYPQYCEQEKWDRVCLFWKTDGGAAEVWTAESGAAGGVGANPRSLCLREWTAGAPA